MISKGTTDTNVSKLSAHEYVPFPTHRLKDEALCAPKPMLGCIIVREILSRFVVEAESWGKSSLRVTTVVSRSAVFRMKSTCLCSQARGGNAESTARGGGCSDDGG